MKTDLYTKIILTIIAACLLWSSLAAPHVVKAEDAQRIAIAEVGIHTIGPDGIPVHLTQPIEGCR